MQIILQILLSLTQCASNVKTVVGVQSFGRTQLWKLRTKIRNVCLKSIFDGHVCHTIRFNPLIFYRIFFWLQNTQLFCFPSTHKFTHSKAFCIFKVKCVWIHAANQFPPDGDKWLAGQKESQEAAPSITTMNYSPSLSLNFQRRMIRQRMANPQQKRSICLNIQCHCRHQIQTVIQSCF